MDPTEGQHVGIGHVRLEGNLDAKPSEHLGGEDTFARDRKEEVAVRCGDKQFRSGATISYGPDGSETDRYTEETSWDPAREGTLYASILSFACEDMRPAGATPYPTIAAFIESGRGR